MAPRSEADFIITAYHAKEVASPTRAIAREECLAESQSASKEKTASMKVHASTRENNGMNASHFALGLILRQFKTKSWEIASVTAESRRVRSSAAV